MEWDIEADATALIEQAVLEGVSDIHLLPQRDNYALFFRQSGQLYLRHYVSFTWGKRLINYFKFKADMDVGEKRRPQSGATHLQLNHTAVELRFSTITNVHLYESLVVRIIQPASVHDTILQTFFPKNLTALRQLIRRKSGLILFSGPVGSGKTTTIYHLLRERIQEELIQIITMEDPVEILEPRFLQTQVNELAGIRYDHLIKAALRHHPDVLIIGEIRDEETARMVIRGALTGHLLIATIHAKNARGVIARLQELRLTDAQLQQTLIGIISQRLIPLFCPFCGGNCELYCPHHLPTAKRAAMLEILTGPALQQQLQFPQQFIAFRDLNQQLRKAWSYGFISDKAYRQFEII